MVKQFQELQKLLSELKLEKKQDSQSLNNEEKKCLFACFIQSVC